jgi:hypothetical protein
MFRAGKSTCLAAFAACLVAALTLLAQGSATAATAARAITTTTGNGGPVSVVGVAANAKTFPVTYGCDLSAYGTGISPVTVSTTLAFPLTAYAGFPSIVELSSDSAPLPAAVLTKLSGVTFFDISATATVKHATVAAAKLSGTAPVAGTLKGLPAGAAAGLVTFPAQGTAVVEVPAQNLTFTPHTATGALAPITCSTTAKTQDVTVDVKLLVVGTSGPLYECALKTGDVSETAGIRVPMAITLSGTQTTGTTDTVTLTVGSGSGSSPAETVSFSSWLPVSGAQQGRITLARTVKNFTSDTLKVSGALRLTEPGTDRILVPQEFAITAKQGTTSATITCAIKTKPVPVGLTVKVTKGSGAHPTASPTSTGTGNGGQAEGSGTPSGAPDTGGGTGPGADLAAAAAGMVIVVSGGGLVALGRRRSRK